MYKNKCLCQLSFSHMVDPHLNPGVWLQPAPCGPHVQGPGCPAALGPAFPWSSVV